MNKIDSEVKTKWVAALRSGEYKQHRSVANDKYNTEGAVFARCCINVGAHVVVGAEADDMTTVTSVRALNLDEFTVSHLINMNDRQKKNFNEIADWIEVNL